MKYRFFNERRAGYLGCWLVSLIVGHWVGSSVERYRQRAEYSRFQGQVSEHKHLREKEIYLRIKDLESEKFILRGRLKELERRHEEWE